MATELGTGYISLSVKYASALSQVSRDLTGVENAAKRSGDRAGRALSAGLSSGSRSAGNDAARSLQEQLGEAVGERIGLRVGRAIAAPISRIMGTAGTEAGQRFSRNFESEANKSSRRTGGNAGAGLLAGLAGVATRAVAVAAPIIGIGSVIEKGFSRLTAIDDAKAKLVGLGNSAENVQKIMDSALASVKGTAFGLDEAATIAASAVAAGVKPGQDLTKYLTEVADAAAIAGTSMNDMGAIFNKITTSNKAMTDDLNQLADRGLPIFQWLQDEYHVTAEELRKMVEDGKVDAATFQKVIDKNIGGAAQKMANSVSGSMKNLNAAISRFGAALVAPVFNQAAGVFSKLTGVVDKATTAIGPLMQRLGATFTAFFQNNIVPAVQQAMPVISRIFNDLKDGAGKFVAGVIPVAKSIGEVLMGAVKAVIPVLGTLGGIFKKVFGGVGTLAQSLGPKLAPLGQALLKLFSSLMPVLKIVGVVVGAAIGLVLAAAAKVLPVIVTVLTWLADKLGTVIGFITGTLVPAIGTGFKAIGTAAMWLWNNVLKPFGSGIATIFKAIGTVAMWLWQNVFVPVWNGITFPARLAWAALQIIFKALQAAFTALGIVAMELWQKYMTPVWEGIKSAISAAWSFIEPVWNNFKAGLQVVGDAAMWLWNNAIVPAWDGIKSAISTAWDFISGIFDKFKNGFQAVVDGVKTIGSGLADGIKSAFNGVVEVIKKPLRALGDILAAMPTSALGVDIPGAQTVVDFGHKLQGLKSGGVAGRTSRGLLYGPGTGTSDSILALDKSGFPTAMVSNGEGVVTAKAMGKGGATLVAALNAGWVPPVEMLRSMLPGYAEGLNPGADYLRQQIMKMWPGVTRIGGKRAEDGLGEHSSGNALDVMIPNWATPEGKAIGDAIASFVIKNKDALGLDGLIWRQTSFGYGGSFTDGKPMADKGSPTQNHMDHVHIILGKGRGAGAPQVNLPSAPLVGGPSGSSSVNPGSGKSDSGGSSSQQQSDNPYTKIIEAVKQILPDFGQLGDIAVNGVKESFLPPGFTDPMQWGAVKAASGILGFVSGLVQDPVARNILGIASAATGGNSNGVVEGITNLIPKPFGNLEANAQQQQPQAADYAAAQAGAPAPMTGDTSTAFTPDPQAGAGGGTTNIDNSVHVAEGGSVGVDPVKLMDKTQRQQAAAQNPQLGTRRFV